jgi:ABC-type uncharacterized transport system ATPase subunit
MNAAIETDNLVKRYGDVTAVDGLSLSVASGEIDTVSLLQEKREANLAIMAIAPAWE